MSKKNRFCRLCGVSCFGFKCRDCFVERCAVSRPSRIKRKLSVVFV